MRYMRDMRMGGMVRQMTLTMTRIRVMVSTHTGSLVLARGMMEGLSLWVLETSITSAPVDLKVSLLMSEVFGPEMRS